MQPEKRALTAPEFHQLAEVSAEAQWFANLDSVQTRRAYQGDLRAFMAFSGIVRTSRISQCHARPHPG